MKIIGDTYGSGSGCRLGMINLESGMTSIELSGCMSTSGASRKWLSMTRAAAALEDSAALLMMTFGGCGQWLCEGLGTALPRLRRGCDVQSV